MRERRIFAGSPGKNRSPVFKGRALSQALVNRKVRVSQWRVRHVRQVNGE